MNSNLEAICIEPRVQARCSVIWLHGLGADGNDFVPVVPELRLPDEIGARFIFPHAPVRPVTLNGGMPMPAWFDITGLDANARQDLEGLEATRVEVDALIEAENERGISTERIAVAGFSQGGAVALYAGLLHAQRLAGIMGLSTWLGRTGNVLDRVEAANRETPIFMAHGEQDPTVLIDFGRSSCESLREAGYNVEWHTYPMGHEVCMEEIRDIGRWLEMVLSAG